MTDPLVLLAGAAVGGGLALAASGLVPAAPDLRAALDRLDGSAGQTTATDPSRGGRSRARQAVEAAGAGLARWWRLDRFRAELDLVGQDVPGLAIRKLGYLLLGLAFPTALSAAMALAGLTLPVPVPALGGLLLGAALFLLVDVDLLRRAAAARADLRETVCAYLELVALERAADAGAGEALTRAAAVGNGPGFTRIGDALTRAELDGVPPWQGLAALAQRTGVAELGDVADIMRLSGQDGAAVYTTLRARAGSLRAALLADATAKANAASEHMIVPVALLGVLFMVLIGYPAFARILFG